MGSGFFSKANVFKRQEMADQRKKKQNKIEKAHNHKGKTKQNGFVRKKSALDLCHYGQNMKKKIKVKWHALSMCVCVLNKRLFFFRVKDCLCSQFFFAFVGFVVIQKSFVFILSWHYVDFTIGPTLVSWIQLRKKSTNKM